MLKQTFGLYWKNNHHLNNRHRLNTKLKELKSNAGAINFQIKS